MTTILDRIVASKRLEIEAAGRRVPRSRAGAPPGRRPAGARFPGRPRRARQRPGHRRGQAGLALRRPHPGRLRSGRHRPHLRRPRRRLHQRADRRAVLPGTSVLPGAGPRRRRAARCCARTSSSIAISSWRPVPPAPTPCCSSRRFSMIHRCRLLFREAHDLGMQCLVELYDAENLPRVLDAGARLIGVNNRDLRTFVTRLEHTLELAARMPPDCCLVSESGIRTPRGRAAPSGGRRPRRPGRRNADACARHREPSSTSYEASPPGSGTRSSRLGHAAGLAVSLAPRRPARRRTANAGRLRRRPSLSPPSRRGAATASRTRPRRRPG